MDKPTPPTFPSPNQEGAWRILKDSEIAAYGEAMAAWGAAQERKRLQALINELLLSDQTPTAVQSKEIDRDTT